MRFEQCYKAALKLSISLFVLIAMVLLTGRAAIADETGKCGPDAEYTYDSYGSLIIKGSGYIEERAFFYKDWKDSITSVYIHEGITEIYDDAFFTCSSIETLSLPNSLMVIRSRAFADCTSLMSVIIPDSVHNIGFQAFSGCTSLSDVTLPKTAALEWYCFDEAPFFDITKKASISLESTSLKYTGEEQKPKVTVKYGSTVLKEGTDYELYYYNNTDIGKAEVNVSGIPEGAWWGSKTLYFDITPISASPDVSLKKSSFVYTGSSIKPEISSVKIGSTNLSSDQYKVTYSSGRKKVGEYSVTVSLTGTYKGSKTLKFKILPKGTKIKNISSEKKNLTVTWTPQKKEIDGYKIYCSKKKNFSGSIKKKTVSKSKKKITFTKLSSGKTYYVKIRTYKKVNGKKYYSEWSKAKKIKVK